MGILAILDELTALSTHSPPAVTRQIAADRILRFFTDVVTAHHRDEEAELFFHAASGLGKAHFVEAVEEQHGAHVAIQPAAPDEATDGSGSGEIGVRHGALASGAASAAQRSGAEAAQAGWYTGGDEDHGRRCTGCGEPPGRFRAGRASVEGSRRRDAAWPS